MSEWKEYKLGDVALLETEKIPVYRINIENYVSTENMIPDRGGIEIANHKPETGVVTKYKKSNILISNIRPYFKKIWLANKEGGCSNDVLCFNSNPLILDNQFLFYVLSQDVFFDYVMLGSKGCKMPRGDKSHIMNYSIALPSLKEQKRIASILSSLDDKIDLLQRENVTLEAMAETLFHKWFIEDAKNEWKELPLSATANFLNGLACQKFPPKNNIEKLPVLKIKELSHGINIDSDWASIDVGQDYIIHTGDVIFAWSASLMVKIWDGEDCILNQHLFKVTSEVYPKWFYYLWCKFHLNEFREIAASHATTMGHIKRGDLDNVFVLIPDKDELNKMTNMMNPIIYKIENNNNEIKTLVKTREILLPKLMSHEI